MRQPSTTVSWVAAAKAMTRVQPTMKARFAVGLPKLTPTRPAATRHCATTIQARRRPTKPSRSAKAKRVDAKKGRATIKAGRGKVTDY